MRVAKSSFRAAARVRFSPSADQLPADPRGVVTRHAGRASSRSSTTRSPSPSSAQPGGNRDAAEIDRRCQRRPPGSASSPTPRRSSCMPTPHSTRWPTLGSNPPISTASRPRRDAGDGRALSRLHPKMDRRQPCRRLLVRDPCPPRRRGDRVGTVQDGADHPRRERPLRRRAHPQCRGTEEPRRPVRAALWADGAAD
jgi:hypothetical protein